MPLTKSDFKQIRIILKEELDNQKEKFEAKITKVKLEALEEIHPGGKHI